MTLVGFWQMTTALEKFFYWPGIGQLYIDSLPQYFQEQFFPGNLGVLLSVVVIFAYLLGFTVLVLDLAYVVVDPRVRLEGNHQKSFSVTPKGQWHRIFKRSKAKPRINHKERVPPSEWLPNLQQRLNIFYLNMHLNLRNGSIGLRRTMREVLRYPSAIIGLILISILIIGSLYAVIAFPYMEIGEEWQRGVGPSTDDVPAHTLKHWQVVCSP